jgi:hypothetical protein
MEDSMSIEGLLAGAFVACLSMVVGALLARG